MRIHHLNCGCMCPIAGRSWMVLAVGWQVGLSAIACFSSKQNRTRPYRYRFLGLRDIKNPYCGFSLFILITLNLSVKYTVSIRFRAARFFPQAAMYATRHHSPGFRPCCWGLEDFEATVHVMQADREATSAWLHRESPLSSSAGTRLNIEALFCWRWNLGLAFEAVWWPDGCHRRSSLIPLIGHIASSHAGISRLTRRRVGSSTRAMPGILSTRDCRNDAAHRVCVPTSDDIDCGSNQDRLYVRHHLIAARAPLFCSHDVVEFETFSNISNTNDVSVLKKLWTQSKTQEVRSRDKKH